MLQFGPLPWETSCEAPAYPMRREYRKGKGEKFGSPTLLNLKDSEQVLVNGIILPHLPFSISSTTVLGAFEVRTSSHERIQKLTRKVKKVQWEFISARIRFQRESGQTGEDLLLWVSLTSWFWKWKWLCGAYRWRGGIFTGEGGIWGSYSLIFISVPSSRGEERFLSLFSLDKRCHGFIAWWVLLICKTNFIVMRYNEQQFTFRHRKFPPFLTFLCPLPWHLSPKRCSFLSVWSPAFLFPPKDIHCLQMHGFLPPGPSPHFSAQI